jgi:ABC-type bacteriocin/lantibiotic exporter with double-glycine peptidase domain
MQQLTQYECGLCCLKMILSYYKNNISMNKLRTYFDSSVNGISLLELKNVALKLNLNVNVKKVDVSVLLRIKKIEPVIVSWNKNHYIILEKIYKNHCIIIDPSIGRLKISHEEFRNGFSNYILILKPNEKFRTCKSTTTIGDYLKYIIVYKKIILWILFISIILQFISIGSPILMENVIDNVILAHKYGVSKLVIFTTIIVIMQISLTYLKNKLMIWFQNNVDYSLMNRFVNHMIRLPYKFFQMRGNGDLIQRLNSNTMIRDIYIQKIMPGFINIMLVLVIFIYMFTRSPMLALAVLTLGISQLLIILLSKSKMKLLTQSQVMAQTEASTFLTEMLSGISTIKTLGLEENISIIWDNILKNQIEKVSNKSKFQAFIDMFINTIIFFAPLFITFLGINQVLHSNISIGELFAFLSLTISFLTPINLLANMINDITMLAVLLERIYDILDEKIEENNIEISSEKINGSISMKNISFRYAENSPYVLTNITLDIPKGNKIAIVGKSGCGKSTLGLLICALYETTTGNIKIDNINYKDINKISLRNNFGVVLQDNFLFNKTISENISIGMPCINIKDIEEAAKVAAIHEDIKKLPMDYNTRLSEAGANLSGGQKQRLSIARAIVRKPSILLLDEATSSLDSITERQIIENIKGLNCTQIIIAHRLTTIKDADKIIVLQDGMIVSTGTHEKLLDSCPYYRNLYESSDC